MAIGQSSLEIVNLLNLDLDVLYQLSFFKKECEHLHAAFFMSRHESTEFEKISTNNY